MRFPFIDRSSRKRTPRGPTGAFAGAIPFPEPGDVFQGNEGDYFVPLLSVRLDQLLPGGSGLVHFLRPRLLEPNGPDTAIRTDCGDYPAYWYPFRRDRNSRYSSIFELSGKVEREPGKTFSNITSQDVRDDFIGGKVTWDNLLDYSSVGTDDWPDANWNSGLSADRLLGRPLRMIGEIDATRFCQVDCGSVLVLDIERDDIIQIFHWS